MILFFSPRCFHHAWTTLRPLGYWGGAPYGQPDECLGRLVHALVGLACIQLGQHVRGHRKQVEAGCQGIDSPPPNFVHLECLLIVLIILCTKSISMFNYLILKSSFIEWFLLSKETLNCRETSFINSLKLSRNFIKLCCQLLSKYNLTQFFTYSTNMFSNWLNCMHGMIVIVYLGTSRTQITEDLGTNNIITSSKHCTQYASKIQYFPFHFTYSNRSRRHRRILEQHSFSTVK